MTVKTALARQQKPGLFTSFKCIITAGSKISLENLQAEEFGHSRAMLRGISTSCKAQLSLLSLILPAMASTHPEEGLESGWQLEGLSLVDTAHRSPSRRGTAGFHCESIRSSEFGLGAPAPPGYTDMKCLEPKPLDLEENKKPSNRGETLSQ